MTLNTILVPTDFSQYSKKASMYALDIAHKYGAQLILLSVVDTRFFNDGFLDLSIEQEVMKVRDKIAKEKFSAFEREISKVEPSVRVRSIMLFGVVFEEIVRCAKEENADLIVMGTHGNTGIAHVLLGSTTEKVIRKAHCPVLVVR